MKKKSSDFVKFAVILSFLSIIIIIYNGLPPTVSMKTDTYIRNDSAEAVSLLENIRLDYQLYAEIIRNIGEEQGERRLSWDERTVNMKTLLTAFLSKRPMAEYCFFFADDSFGGRRLLGKFYDRSGQLQYDSSLDPIKLSGKQLEKNADGEWLAVDGKLYYFMSFYDERGLMGIIGCCISAKNIKSLFPEKSPVTPYKSMLITSDGSIAMSDITAEGESLEAVEDGKYSALAKQIREKTDGTYYMKGNYCAFMRLSNGLTYIQIYKSMDLLFYTDFMVCLIALAAIILPSLVQRRGKNNISALERLSMLLMKDYINDLSPQEENRTRAIIAMHCGVILAMAAHIIQAAIAKSPWYMMLSFVVITAVPVSLLKLYKKTRPGGLKAVIMTVGLTSGTIFIHFIHGGFAAGNAGDTLMWMMITVFVMLFGGTTSGARRMIYVFAVILPVIFTVEVFVLGNMRFDILFTYLTSILIITISLYSAIELYVVRSEGDYKRLDEVHSQLINTQSMLVQHEKMVTLGRLIAGIAHEINTPIGAIKASGESISTRLKPMLSTLISLRFDRSEREVLLKIIDLSADSIHQMKSTHELRAAKRKLRVYLAENGMDDLMDGLSRLELCDTGLIEANKELFQHPQVHLMIQTAIIVSPLYSGAQTITYASGRISRIVQALRSYSRQGDISEMQAFDIVQSLETVLLLYYNQTKNTIEVERIYPEQPPLVYGNPDEIGQVWTNLIQNAIYAMKETGKLTISVSSTGSYVSVSVRDTGSGMSPEVAGRIFDAFFTTKPMGEGSGLGLDICKKIVDGHNGKITFTSEEGVGTEFTVTLPTGGGMSRSGETAAAGDTDVK